QHTLFESAPEPRGPVLVVFPADEDDGTLHAPFDVLAISYRSLETQMRRIDHRSDAFHRIADLDRRADLPLRSEGVMCRQRDQITGAVCGACGLEGEQPRLLVA